MRTFYIAFGDVRGDCGHAHRTARAAAVCVERDRRGCRSQGGYSDRIVLRQYGTRREAQTVEMSDMDRADAEAVRP